MKHSEELKALLSERDCNAVTFKEKDNALIAHAVGYSCHSAIFDKAFRLADKLGIKWGTHWATEKKVGGYAIIFKTTKKTA